MTLVGRVERNANAAGGQYFFREVRRRAANAMRHAPFAGILRIDRIRLFARQAVDVGVFVLQMTAGETP